MLMHNFFLGIMYQHGDGAKEDYKKAIEWYEKVLIRSYRCSI